MSSKSTFSDSTAKSYALALYELSNESSNLNKIEEEVESLNRLLNESLDFKETVSNPTISKEDKKKIIKAISEKNNFSKIFNNFLSFIATKNRLFFLSKIIESFLN